MLEPGHVYHADCFDLMSRLEPASVDAIITDMPYGTTACSWDTVVDLPTWWAAVKRVLKPRAAFVTTASQPFTSALVMSNPETYSYSWVWLKNRATGFANAKHQPLRKYEDVLVFYASTYYPQNLKRVNRVMRNSRSTGGKTTRDFRYGETYIQEYENYPDNVLCFDIDEDELHPTQKPVELYEYLLRTYTQPGELVLDPFCGSGTTAIAALNTDRQFIVGDFTREYVDITERRIANWRRDGDIEVAPGVTQLGLFA